MAENFNKHWEQFRELASDTGAAYPPVFAIYRWVFGRTGRMPSCSKQSLSQGACSNPPLFKAIISMSQGDREGFAAVDLCDVCAGEILNSIAAADVEGPYFPPLDA